MLRCVWVRLSTTQVRRMRLMEAWRRDRRGAGGVGGAGRWQRGEAARPGLADRPVGFQWGFSGFWQRMSWQPSSPWKPCPWNLQRQTLQAFGLQQTFITGA